jgi:hypothetical protein
MIVHAERGLWQVGKAENAELGGKRKDRIGAKRLKEETGGKRRGRRPEIILVSMDICLKSRERNWFMEGSVRWEGWDTGAARACHRLGREKFLLARLGMMGGVRLVEGSGCWFREADAGQPGAGVGRS